MKRPSAAQRKVLEHMARGDELWTHGGLHMSVFWHGAIGSRAPSTATLFALKSAGWIAAYETEWRGSKYRITEAGRAAAHRGD